jgi:hypothetical protein
VPQTNFKWDSARALKAGMTRQEIIERMGPPNQITVQNTAEGLKETYIWFYITYDLFGTNSKSVSAVLLNGKVISVPTVPDSYKDND